MAERDLATLIRLHKWRLDELRRTLKELQDQEEMLIAMRRRLNEQIRAEMAASSAHAQEGGLMFAPYIRVAKEQGEALERARIEVTRRIEATRAEMAEGFKELKTFEIAEENRAEAERQERARKEQVILDDMGLTLHRRHAKDVS